MSHFTVLVVGEDHEKQLAPFEEFECTGNDSEYVQDVDRTEEARAEYESSKVTRLQDADGKLHEPWADEFYREPTEAELKKAGKHGFMGSGWSNGVSFTSKDWGDGKGYRGKIRFIPEGMTEIEVPQSQLESFRDFIESYYGTKPLKFGGSLDLKEEHKYGHIELDKDGNVVRFIDRTNPNKKWDWFQVGGRWAGMFKLKEGATGKKGEQSWGLKLNKVKYETGFADQAYKGDIDFDGMREKKMKEAAEEYDRLLNLLGGEIPKLKYSWKEVLDGERFKGLEIDEKRAIYHAQAPLVQIENLRKGKNVSDDDSSFLCWLEYPKFTVGRDEFIAEAGRSAVSTFAVILDGKWYERGEMGWWGAVHDEKNGDDWNKEFEKLLASIPDDTLLTVVDCHI